MIDRAKFAVGFDCFKGIRELWAYAVLKGQAIRRKGPGNQECTKSQNIRMNIADVIGKFNRRLAQT